MKKHLDNLLNAKTMDDVTGELKGLKYSNMINALDGKENALTFDRWWARMGEKPEAGIFINAQEGAIEGPEYKLMMEVVGREAAKHNMSMAEFTATAWDGMSKLIENNTLWGQPAKYIAGKEKGFGTIWTELMVKKAKVMSDITGEDISVGKFQKMLGEGHGNLFSYVLMAPVAAALFAKWKSSETLAADEGT